MGTRLRMGLTVTSALMVALSFPPMGWWGLALLAWTPFFMVVREMASRQAFYYGLLHGFLAFGMSVSWLWNIFSFGAVALWALLALFPACWAWMYVKLRTNKAPMIPLVAAILWTGKEYMRGELFILSFPWITPGTALPPNLLTPIVGTYGVSFFVILSGLLLIEPGKKTELSGLILALMVLGAIGMTPQAKPNGEPLKIALIQNEELNLPHYLAQSSVLPGYVDLIVWPEYALAKDPKYDSTIEKEIVSLLQKRAQLLVTGGPTWHNIAVHDWSNTAFSFGRNGLVATHYKNHPVHLFEDGNPGVEAKAFDTEMGRFGTPICFDCDHQDVARRMAKDGAELLLVPAMNKASWSARQHLQHGAHIRHRAAENGRWVAMAATSGVTQIIDSFGNVVKQLPLMKPDTLIGEVYLENRETFFQKGGWLFGPLMMTVGSIILAYSLKRRIKGKLLERKAAIKSANEKIKKVNKQPRPPRSFYD